MFSRLDYIDNLQKDKNFTYYHVTLAKNLISLSQNFMYPPATFPHREN